MREERFSSTSALKIVQMYQVLFLFVIACTFAQADFVPSEASVLQLGYDYRWVTDIGYNGSISQGVLRGNLIIKGGGDPDLKDEDVFEIAQYIRDKGIRKIEGNIILDRSIFDTSGGSSARFDENPYSPYNALPDAIMFNQNLSHFMITPQGSQIAASKSFDDRSYKIKNRLRAVNAACRYRYSWPRVDVDQGNYPAVVTLSGDYSLKCPQRELDYIVTRSYYAFYFALIEALSDLSVSVEGKLKLASAKGYKKLFSHKSKTLEEIISETNKESNNLFARQIFLMLGYARYGEHSSLNNSREALRNILYEKGVTNLSKIKIDNGCGLSRSVRANTLF
ncbi:MAG: D-alanyl-D-alanine carboxypeptidase/D-alanyl-D-alanine-endopeptidase, partial [Sulfurovaceae bacterium]